MNLTAGGLFGYCSSKCITSLKVPSSKGVSVGPIITAFLIFACQFFSPDLATQEENLYQVITLSATGEAETPAGGSVCMRCKKVLDTSLFLRHRCCEALTLKSRIKRRRAAVDILSLLCDDSFCFFLEHLNRSFKYLCCLSEVVNLVVRLISWNIPFPREKDKVGDVEWKRMCWETTFGREYERDLLLLNPRLLGMIYWLRGTYT